MTDQIIFFNGNVLTIDSKTHEAEALAISGGKIIGV